MSLPKKNDLKEYVYARSVTNDHTEADELIKKSDPIVKLRAVEAIKTQTPLVARMVRKYIESTKPKHLFELGPDDTYYYFGYPLEIPDDSLYFHVFDIIMRFANHHKGISYLSIRKHLIEREHLIKLGYDKHANLSKQIREQIVYKTQGFFRYVTYNGDKPIANQLPNRPDQKIFSAKKNHIFVNNPLL